MADALRELGLIQAGLEAAATPGTLVAATRKVIFRDGTYSPIRERGELDEVRGVLAIVDDVENRRASELELEQTLDYEQIVLPFLCGLDAVTPTTTGALHTWTFEPVLTAPEPVRSATWEIVQSDGATRHYSERFGHAQATTIGISIAPEAPATFSTDWIGRSSQALAAPTGSLSEVARELITGDLVDVSIDDTWAGLGGTSLGAQIRSLDIEINTGISPAPRLKGRADKDFAKIERGPITGRVELVCDLDASIAAELQDWRDGDLRFLRAAAEGPSSRSLNLDFALRYIETPEILQRDGSQVTISLEGMIRYDPTSARCVRAVVATPSLSAW